MSRPSVHLVGAEQAAVGTGDGRIDLECLRNPGETLPVLLGSRLCFEEILDLPVGVAALERLAEVVAEREVLADPALVEGSPEEETVAPPDLDVEQVSTYAHSPAERRGRRPRHHEPVAAYQLRCDDRADVLDDAGSLVADPQPRLQNFTTTGGLKKREKWVI